MLLPNSWVKPQPTGLARVIKVATVIFDLDGTLVDSLPDIAESVNRMLAGIGFPPLDHTTVRRFVGNGLPKLVERVIVQCGIDAARHAELTRTTLRHYNEVSCDRTVLYPGVAGRAYAASGSGTSLGALHQPNPKVRRATFCDSLAYPATSMP